MADEPENSPPAGSVVVVDPKGPLSDTAISDTLEQMASGNLPVFDPFPRTTAALERLEKVGRALRDALPPRDK